ERRQRVPVGAAAHGYCIGGNGDVLAAREEVVAEPLRRFGDARDILDRRVTFPLGVPLRCPSERGRDDAERDHAMRRTGPIDPRYFSIVSSLCLEMKRCTYASSGFVSLLSTSYVSVKVTLVPPS